MIYLSIILTVLVLIPMLAPALQILFSSFIPAKKISKELEPETDFACVITAYKDYDLSIHLINSLLSSEYRNFHIYLVADRCDVSSFPFTDPKLTVMKPPSALDSKVRSVKYGIENFERKHSHSIIFDPDNLVPKNYLKEMNKFILSGYDAVQGQRTAKNLNTLFACLDAASEIYHNVLERKVPYKFRMSSTLSGSGMGFKTELLYDFLVYEEEYQRNVESPEDKLFQIYLVTRGHKIAYAEKALVYDEKINDSKQARGQRIRWINSYFHNISSAIKTIGKGIGMGNPAMIFFGLKNLNPPIFLSVIAALIVTVMNLFLNIPLAITTALGILIFTLNFIIVLKLEKTPKEVWLSLWGIPLFMANQVWSLFNLKIKDKEFLVSKNTNSLSINELSSKNKIDEKK